MDKRIKHLTILIIGAVLGLLASCSNEEELGNFTPMTPEFSFDQNAIQIPKEGGEFAVNVKSNLPWRAKANVDWISFTKENALADGNFVFVVARNRSLKEREAEIKVWVTDEALKTIQVVQAPSEAGELVTHYHVKASGEENNDGLSWATATTLEMAMDRMVDGDTLHIAAGSYSPTRVLTGGTAGNTGDITFEIHSNVTMIGGYPADAKEGDLPDPTTHPTVLSGSLASGKAFHTVAVSAPKGANKKVVLQGLSIKNGEAAASGTGSVSINGVPFYRFYAGGLIIGKSTVDIIDCEIADNKSGLHAGGIYIAGGGEVRFERTVIRNNVSTTNSSNGGGVFIDASTVYFNECSIVSNGCTGVGAGIYAFNANSPTYTYLYNSTIAYNTNDANGVNQTRRGGGFYARENSVTVIVNSTIYGNSGGIGAGISAYGASGKTAKLDVISSTISGNNAFKTGGGIEIANAFASVNFYNSIVSGNTGMEGYPEQQGTAKWYHSILANKTYDTDGNELSTAPSFDVASMLGSLADNGGKTGTCALIGNNNPAVSLGMSTNQLEQQAGSYDPVIPTSIVSYDQTGKSRSNTSCIGAVVKD